MLLNPKSLAVAGVLLGAVSLVHATAFTIDDFTIERNGSLFFQDTFDNGDPMDTGYVFNSGPAQYSTIPDSLPGTEANSRYTMDPLAGQLTTSALTGNPIYTQRARVITNTSNNTADLGRGLKVDDAIRVTGTFDITAPTIVGERYGVRLSDRAVNGTYDDIVEVTMQLQETGVYVQFREQDVLNGTYNLFDSVAFSAAALGLSEADFAMFDQIAMFLDRPDANSGVFGGFTLLDLDGLLDSFTYNFSGSATLFEGELFTVAEFIAIAPATSVPEASSLSMMGLGMLLLAGMARRRRKSH